MGNKTINLRLSESSINAVKRYLREYQKTLRNKNVEFVKRLAERGISVGEQHTGEYGDYIVFTYTPYGSGKTRAEGRITISKKEFVRRYWYYKGELTYADVDPVLMAEYGSGMSADPESFRGTFPGQKHADPYEGPWHWTDENGETHESSGESPTYPGAYTVIGIIKEVESVAREVFGP